MLRLITFGYSMTACAWLVMFYNLFMPFEGQIELVLKVLLALTIMMHGLQLIVLNVMFSSGFTLKIKDYLIVYIFGVFGLLAYRYKLTKHQ